MSSRVASRRRRTLPISSLVPSRRSAPPAPAADPPDRSGLSGPSGPSGPSVVPSEHSSGTTSSWRALRSGSLRLWVVANTLSSAGTWMQLIAQNVLVLQLTGSVALTGLSLSVQALPGLLLGVSGGALVDRWPRRLTAAGGQVSLALIAFTTAGLAASGHLTVPVLLALGLASGTIATVDGPAAALLGNDLVPREDVASAIAVGSVAGNVGRLAGTAAGSAVAAVGIPLAYAANGVSFLLVAAVVPLLRLADRPVEERAEHPVEPTARGGLSYLLRHRSLVVLLAIGALTTLLGKNYSLSMAALVTGPLGATAADYGTVSIALAAGGIVGALAAGRLRRPSLQSVVLWSGVAAGIQALTGASPFLIGLIILVVPMAAAEAAAATATETLLQTLPPEHLRGRVLGGWRTASTAWGLAGPPTFGLVLEVAGVRAGLALGGVVVVLLLAAGALRHCRGAAAADAAGATAAGATATVATAAVAQPAQWRPCRRTDVELVA